MWTDDNGIKHITNTVPPEGAEILLQTEEIPYDEKADKERREAEQLEKAIAVRQEILDLEVRLIEMQQAAEQRIEAANRKAQDALEYAEYWKSSAQENYSGFAGRRFRYYGYTPICNSLKYSHLKRWYYRNKDHIYDKPSHHNYHKSYPNKHHLNKQPVKYRDKRRHVKRHKSVKTRYNGNRYRPRVNGYRSGTRYGRLN
jgi:hypothetical protein